MNKTIGEIPNFELFCKKYNIETAGFNLVHKGSATSFKQKWAQGQHRRLTKWMNNGNKMNKFNLGSVTMPTPSRQNHSRWLKSVGRKFRVA